MSQITLSRDRSTRLRFDGGGVAFCIDFVSWPVYTTTPNTLPVFWRLESRRSNWGGPTGSERCATFKRPENVYNDAFGASQSNSALKSRNSLPSLPSIPTLPPTLAEPAKR